MRASKKGFNVISISSCSPASWLFLGLPAVAGDGTPKGAPLLSIDSNSSSPAPVAEPSQAWAAAFAEAFLEGWRSVEIDSRPPPDDRSRRRRRSAQARSEPISSPEPPDEQAQSVMLAAEVILAGWRLGACVISEEIRTGRPKTWIRGGGESAQLANAVLAAGHVTGRVLDPA